MRTNKFRAPNNKEKEPLDKESKSVNIGYYDSDGTNLFVNKSAADISIDLSLNVSLDKPNNLKRTPMENQNENKTNNKVIQSDS